MAADDASTNRKSKTGLGGFPARFKDFVHDMKGFTKDIHRHRRGVRSEQVMLKQPLPFEDVIPKTPEIFVSDTRSLFQDTPRVRSLSVRVTVKFDEPLNYAHSQDYEGSSSLQPTEELCEALLHRVDHCSKELITRKDSGALDRTGTDGVAKPLRYEIQVQILRNDLGAWASRTIRSYQRQPVGTEAARDVIIFTHQMVGLFLKHHDESFVWKDGPVREDPSQEQKTFPYRPGRVQPLTSIPRSHFIEKQQVFESLPGYTASLSLTSSSHCRNPPQWHETVEVNSHQSSPLTLASAESLFFDACYAVDGVFRSERKNFEAHHQSCTNHNGCGQCQPRDDDGIEMMLSISNNIGPQFDHLERTTQARVNVFCKDHEQDCIEFVEKAKAAISQVRQEVDESVSRINDLEFHVVELRGRGWMIDQPMLFTLGPESCMSRQSVEALLDRLQTGVADILRGNAIAVRMTARKRGHFILDKTLVAREPIEKSGNKRKSPEKSKAYVLDRLRQRIERDIEMVCKDTCSIVNREIETAKVNSGPPKEDTPSMNTNLSSPRSLSDITTPSKRTADGIRDSSASKLASGVSEMSVTPEPLSTYSPIPLRQWARVTRDLETGLRLFPLVPKARGPHSLSSANSDELNPRDHNHAHGDTTKVPKFGTHLTRATSDFGTSIREQKSAGVSLTDSLHYAKERNTTEESSISTRPHTPSLEFDGSPSIRSSLLITPKTHHSVSSNEFKFLQISTPDVYGGADRETEKTDKHLNSSFVYHSAFSPAPRLLSPDAAASSPTRKAEPVQEQRLSSLDSEDIATPTDHISTPDRLTAEREEQRSNNKFNTTEELGGEYTRKERCEPAVTEELSSPETENYSQSELEHEEAELPISAPEAEIGAFSQSKPDFDFSSPLTATTPGGSEATEEAPPPAANDSNKKHDQETSSDPSDEEYSDTPVRPELAAFQQRHKSFGSAGYLGSFHEQRFYGLGLRHALGGGSPPPSRPFSPAGEMEGQKERPGTAM